MAIADLKFDANGNMWGLLSSVDNPLFVKTRNNEWYKFSISSSQKFLFDESLTYENPATGAASGAFKLTLSNGDPIGLRTNSISSGGAIYLQPGGAGAVTAFKVNYETYVTAPNDIPNKKYVDDEIALAIATLAPVSIERGDTEVRVYDTSLG